MNDIHGLTESLSKEFVKLFCEKFWLYFVYDFDPTFVLRYVSKIFTDTFQEFLSRMYLKIR